MNQKASHAIWIGTLLEAVLVRIFQKFYQGRATKYVSKFI